MAKKGWYWPWLLATGMSGIVGVNVWMLFVATGDANGSVVEPDYYRKAVAWDSTMALRAASDALGWSAELRLSGALLVVRLSDAAGAAVIGATVQATLIHNADASRHVEVVLRDLGDGRYSGATALTYPGRWEVRIDATRGRAHYVATRHAELVSPPSAD